MEEYTKRETQKLSEDVIELKCAIQDILDQQAIKESDELQKLKEDHLSRLNCILDKIKEIKTEEKKQKKKEEEIRNVCRQNDTLDFRGAKQKGTDAIDAAKRNMLLRENAKKQFLSILETEKQFDMLDTPSLPGRLFLHKNVTDAYGYCPYILWSDDDTSTTLLEKRNGWLLQQHDKGEVYFNLYKDIVEDEQMTELIKEKDMCEDNFMQFICDSLNDVHKESFRKSLDFLNTYVQQNVKTKKVKDLYKAFVNDLSIIQNSCKLPLCDFLMIKYKCHVYVNENSPCHSDGYSNAEIYAKTVMFDDLLKQYRDVHERIDCKHKYRNNTYKNIKNELYNYLSKQCNNDEVKEKVVRDGKFFVKWSQLSKDDRQDRFFEFAKYFLTINDNDQNDETLDVRAIKIAEMLLEAYNRKELSLKTIKWSVKNGIIKDVVGLKYDAQNKNILMPVNEPHKQSQRRSSKSNKFTKFAEQVLNEEILQYIVRLHENGELNSDEREIIKQKCFEILKNKLKLKKFGDSQKTIINDKFDEMFDLIILNSDV
uniref:Uncharacterized protein n=1 Tax=viral metagenome TaxID=1070528 RepID=A0A6C0DZ99_9ZZZZ